MVTLKDALPLCNWYQVHVLEERDRSNCHGILYHFVPEEHNFYNVYVYAYVKVKLFVFF
jgi:hypothetical protein